VNTGRQIARKVEMQNAADAAAVSSAVWIARGMNIVSMDNVGMTEALGLVANLQAMHVAWQVNEVILQVEFYAAEAMLDSIILAPAGVVLMVGVIAGWIPTCAIEGVDGFPNQSWMVCSPPDGDQFAGDSVNDGNFPYLAHPTDGKLWVFM